MVLFSVLQSNKFFWTNGDPISTTFYNLNDKSWLLSWSYYVQNLQWQSQYLKYLNTYRFDAALLSIIHDLNITTTKAKLITNLLETNNTGYLCTLLLLWHPSSLNWIKVPCNDKLLDRGAVLCQDLKVKWNETIHNQMLKFLTVSIVNLHSSSNLYNIFYCRDGKSISIILICNNIYDCIDGSDELSCKCSFMGKKIFNSSLYISKCQVLTCVCLEPLKKFKLECKPFIGKTFPVYDAINLHFNCHSKEIYCIYDLVNRNIRMQKFCKTGYHLRNCENIDCVLHFKCFLYYCLPWKYVCDGLLGLSRWE